MQLLVCERNSDNFTYDGIEVGGERVSQEIEDKLRELEAKGQHITKLSIVGYSLGGLIARYCIGLLYSRGWFDKLRPVNFTAFASPFLGVRTPHKGYHSYLYNALASQMLSASGKQLFLVDNFRGSGRTLLEILADPKSIFMIGLKCFQRRTLYANIINDRSAPWFTTFITRSDPFVDLDKVKLNYLKGHDSVLLDPKNPVQLKAGLDDSTYYERLVTSSSSLVQSLPTYALFGLLLPIGFTAFTVNAGIQTFRSAQRVQLHNTGKAGSFDAYRIPFLLDGAMESVNAAEQPQYLSDTEAAGQSDSDASSTREKQQGSAALYRTRSQPEFPVLALDKKQFQMIDALNELGFNKYPVHISKVRHSHAAIIVRKEANNMDEGFVVLKHWLDEEFDV